MTKSYTQADREAVLALIVEERRAVIEAVRADLIAASDKLVAACNNSLYADGVPSHINMIHSSIASFLTQTNPPPAAPVASSQPPATTA